MDDIGLKIHGMWEYPPPPQLHHTVPLWTCFDPQTTEAFGILYECPMAKGRTPSVCTANIKAILVNSDISNTNMEEIWYL